MKLTLSIAKSLFLFVLLGTNVIGFHYYFKPVASDNLKYIPANASFVFTINLKSISGKLFNELLFDAEAFEKDLLSKDEKKLVFDNSSHGVSPFGLITIFRFSFKEKMIDGISFNLDDHDAFIGNLEEKNFEKLTVDEIDIFKDENKSFFVFENVSVLLFSGFEKEDAENIAVTTLQNEAEFEKMGGADDFSMFVKKGILKNSSFKRFFRLVPDFAESVYIFGNLEKGKIDLQGEMRVSNLADWPASIPFVKNKILKSGNPLQFSINGKEIKKPMHGYLNAIFDARNGETGQLKEFLNGSYEGLKMVIADFNLPVDLLSIGADVMDGKWFNPSYRVDIALNSSSKVKRVDEINMEMHFKNVEMNAGDNRKVKAVIDYSADIAPSSGYFYFNPIQFLDAAEMNMFIRSAIDPFLIVEDVVLQLQNYKDGKLKFGGEVNLVDKDIHSLVQFRMLFKNISSLL